MRRKYRVPSKLEIDEAFQASVQHGLMEVIGNENGEDVYRITKKGERYVEAMPDRKKMKEILDGDC